jgi:hypothetical protein
MIRLLGTLLAVVGRLFGSRRELLLENLALRQQLVVLKRNCLGADAGTPESNGLQAVVAPELQGLRATILTADKWNPLQP